MSFKLKKHDFHIGRDLPQIVDSALGQMLEYARQKASQFAPGSTYGPGGGSGLLAGSKGGRGQIDWKISRPPGGTIIGVLTATAMTADGVDYARFVEEGTGLFGPHQTLIRPQKAKVLVFLVDRRFRRPQTSEEWRSLRRRYPHLIRVMRFSRGMKAQWPLKRGLEAARAKSRAIFQAVLEAYREEKGL